MPKFPLFHVSPWDDIWPTFGEPGLSAENIPVRFRISERGRIWEVFRDNRFWGVFQTRAEADDHVRQAMINIFTTGGAAQLRFG